MSALGDGEQENGCKKTQLREKKSVFSTAIKKLHGYELAVGLCIHVHTKLFIAVMWLQVGIHRRKHWGRCLILIAAHLEVLHLASDLLDLRLEVMDALVALLQLLLSLFHGLLLGGFLGGGGGRGDISVLSPQMNASLIPRPVVHSCLQ